MPGTRLRAADTDTLNWSWRGTLTEGKITYCGNRKKEGATGSA